jgi:Beta-lactamase superfamily domain
VDLVFLGTRGDIEKKTRRHRRHSALFVKASNGRVLVDCGADWLGRIEALRPTAIIVTHAHPDHVQGLANGAPCPVYATAETWPLLAAYPISERRIMPKREPIDVHGIVFEAFPVEHSIRAPAVGYRIAANQRSAFYVPDVVAIRDPAAALFGIGVYIGDGASMTRPIIRRCLSLRCRGAFAREQASSRWQELVRDPGLIEHRAAVSRRENRLDPARHIAGQEADVPVGAIAVRWLLRMP